MQFSQPTFFNIKNFASCFLVGICLLQKLYYYKSQLFITLVFFLFFYCYLFYKCNKFKRLLLWLILNLFSVGIGFTWMWFHVYTFKKHSCLSCMVEGKQILVQGKVLAVNSSEQQYFKKIVRYLEFDLEIYKIIIAKSPKNISHKVRLKWINSNNNLVPGDIWQLYVKLKKPRNFSTNGGFDLEKYLFAQRIHMIGKVINSSNNILIVSNQFSCIINKIRYFIVNKINIAEQSWNLSKKGIILALGLGINNAISSKDKIIFQNTGTAHLLAISGLHIGFVTGLIFLIINFLWKKLANTQLLEKLPAPIVGAIASIISAGIYASLAGFSISTVRALIMTNIYFGGIILRKIITTKQIYFLAMIFILFLDPFVSLSMSFWLSFLAVGILLYSYKELSNIVNNDKKKIIFKTIFNLAKTNWLMLIGLLPINGLLFGKISLISYVANFVAVPWVNFLVLPWILIGILFFCFNIALSKYFFIFADVNLILLLKILNCLSSIPYATIELANPKLPVFLISCIGSILLLVPKGLFNKYLAVICFLPIFLSKKSFPQYGDAFVSVLDVGQGLATIIQLKNHILLYDAGPNNKVVLNYLKSLNNTNIDQAIISHTDQDHIGGLEDLVSKQIVKNFSTNIDAYQVLNLTAKLCQSDYSWQLDGVDFKFLYPDRINYSENNNFNILNKNDNSCVLHMRTNKHTMLFTGDISQKLEKLLVAKYSDQLKSDVLLIPHHGSLSSSSEQFIQAVSPKYAVVSAGYMNMYGHPRQEVLAKYLTKNILILNTIEHGAIDLKFKSKLIKSNQTEDLGGTIEYNCYRIANRNFWNY